MTIEKIVSGGQTGVDRAALDIAIKLEIPHGGWCSRERRAEDGSISENYLLQETDSEEYSERTKRNIRDSDGTLIIVRELPIRVTDGTVLTIEEVRQKQKPYLIIGLNDNLSIESITTWIEQNHIKVLNIAGPRESQSPGIYEVSSVLIENLITYLLANTKNSLLPNI